MAAASVAVPSAFSPLETTTNSPPLVAYAKSFSFSAVPDRSKSLRRTNSLRRIQQKSDASDSEPPSPQDSIYNAERVEPGEVLPQEEQAFQLPPPVLSIFSHATSKVKDQITAPATDLLKPLSSRSPPLGHSNWPEPRLDTILEQNSTRSLRQSASAPRLQSSPERSAQYIKAQSSIHSIRPMRADRNPWPREKPLPATGIHYQHSFSMNDLDCLQRIISNKNEHAVSGTFCSSPLTKLQAPMFPARPRCPPPEYPKTPDGLPKFGSKEAQQLRLTPAKQKRHGAVHRWFRGEHDTEEEPSGADSNFVTSPTTQLEEGPFQDLLKRVFGMNRPVGVPDSSINPRPRAPLPPGVTSANSPGILAMADDGTPIRGKFGTRTSGHGIGTRSLDDHPMARIPRQELILEQVEQIEKACERINRGNERNHLRQLPQMPTIDSELTRHVIRAQRELGGRIGGLERRPASDSRGSLRSPPIPPSNTPYPAPVSPLMSPHGLSESLNTMGASGFRSASSSLRMREPG
jgi:hypothetical protein